MSFNQSKLELVASSVEVLADDIKTFEFRHPLGLDLPSFAPGSSLRFQITPGLARQYSLANDPRENARYVIAVKREPSSRGGSSAMHMLTKGDRVDVQGPICGFPLENDDGNHLLLSAGIGITPLIAMAHALHASKRAFRLKHFVRSEAQANTFDRLLDRDWLSCVDKYSSCSGTSTNERLQHLATTTPQGTRVYVCGPTGFIDFAQSVFEPVVGQDRIRAERFVGDAVSQTGRSFALEVECGGRHETIEVAGDQTILEAMRAHGMDLMTSCEMGICGTCLSQVLEGEVDHRDSVLTDQERSSGIWIIPCVSRSAAGRLKIKVP